MTWILGHNCWPQYEYDTGSYNRRYKNSVSLFQKRDGSIVTVFVHTIIERLQDGVLVEYNELDGEETIAEGTLLYFKFNSGWYQGIKGGNPVLVVRHPHVKTQYIGINTINALFFNLIKNRLLPTASPLFKLTPYKEDITIPKLETTALSGILNRFISYDISNIYYLNKIIGMRNGTKILLDERYRTLWNQNIELPH